MPIPGQSLPWRTARSVRSIQAVPGSPWCLIFFLTDWGNLIVAIGQQVSVAVVFGAFGTGVHTTKTQGDVFRSGTYRCLISVGGVHYYKDTMKKPLPLPEGAVILQRMPYQRAIINGSTIRSSPPIPCSQYMPAASCCSGIVSCTLPVGRICCHTTLPSVA